MNRQQLIRCIESHLRDVREAPGEPCALGELVARVARDVRGDAPLPASSPGKTSPTLPVTLVAAFVDGTVTELESAEVVEAVMRDNSVLAEVISAMRADDATVSLPPLSTQLSGRLSQMLTTELSKANDAPVATIAKPIVEAEAPPVNARKVKVARGASRPWKRGAGLLVGFAAAALIAFVVTRDWKEDPNGNEIVVIDPPVPAVPDRGEMPESTDPVLNHNPGDLPPSSEAIVRDGQKPRGAVRPDESISPDPNLPRRNTAPDVEQVPLIVHESNDPPVMDTPPAIETPAPRAVANNANSPDPRPSRPPTRLREMRWGKINGILAQKNSTESDPDYRGMETWRVLSKDVDTLAQSSVAGKPVSLRTLTLSRAQADFMSGGRMVLAADSALQFNTANPNASARIDIEFGAVALMNLPEGTVIQLRGGQKPLARLDWESKASAVIQYGNDGLQVHVQGGAISVASKSRRNESVVIAADRSVTSIDKPKRLPTWVDSSIGTLPPHIQAQFSDSQNLMASMSKRLATLPANPTNRRDRDTELAIASMQASLVGGNLFRLGSSPRASVRAAAFTRLLSLPVWDSRYRTTWALAARMIGDQQKTQRLRSIVTLLRQGTRPGNDQVLQLVNALEAPELPNRAIADFLLRKIVGNGPVFDPTAQPRDRARAVAEWRKRLGIPVARGAAAVRGNQP